MADLKTNLLGFVMNSPVIGASGTVGYGVEYEELADFAKIGGISGKGLTLHGQYGNKGERLWETPSGLINSIGLQNPGVQHFIDVELPEMLELKQKYGTVAIANLGGHSEEEYVEGAAMLSESAVDIVELNISCPNVKVGGMAYGVKAAGEVVRMVRAACKKPLMVKLSPQAENIPEMCKAVEAAGADAISLTNTFQACAIDLEKRRPVFNNIFAGLSGPAVRPIALRMVWQAVGAVNIPVVGLGGIATGRDALEFIMAGATAVQVGAANFANPRAMETIANEMAAWMDKNGVKTLDEIRGCARHAE
jgi:dihydroorotate dehydrogenase (NAD+) catalytic subunit